MNQKSALKWVTVLIVSASLAGAGYIFIVKLKGKTKRQYKEYVIERGKLEVFVQATGQVQPENRLVVKPSIAGRIESVLADEGKHVKAGQILGWMSSNDRAALLDIAKAKGDDEVKHWESIYKPSPIMAPLSGFVIAKNIEPGQVVATSDVAFVVSDRLVVNAQVDETDLARVKMNQDVVIQLDAYSDHAIEGKVSRIAYEARTANSVTIYDIRVLPSSVPDFMRSGMTASVKFMETVKEQVLKLPIGLFRKQKSPKELKKAGITAKVLVKTGEDSGETQTKDVEVVLGASDGKTIEIVSGLSGSEIVLEDVTPEESKSANPFNPFAGQKKSSQGGQGTGTKSGNRGPNR
jgi:membrane fusion protein, macrolide-specific efflux system